jgi:hypothetical protein
MAAGMCGINVTLAMHNEPVIIGMHMHRECTGRPKGPHGSAPPIPQSPSMRYNMRMHER